MDAWLSSKQLAPVRFRYLAPGDHQRRAHTQSQARHPTVASAAAQAPRTRSLLALVVQQPRLRARITGTPVQLRPRAPFRGRLVVRQQAVNLPGASPSTLVRLQPSELLSRRRRPDAGACTTRRPGSTPGDGSRTDARRARGSLGRAPARQAGRGRVRSPPRARHEAHESAGVDASLSS